MWLTPILSALFPPDNAPPSDLVRERIDDQRGLWLAGRLGFIAGFLASGVALVAGADLPVVLPVLLLGAGALLEVAIAGMRRAASLRVLERDIALWSMIFVGWAAVIAYVLGGAASWPGFIAYAVVVAAAGAALTTRGTALVIIAAGTLFLGAGLAEALNVLPPSTGPGAPMSLPPAQRAAALGLAVLVAFPLIGGTTQAASRRMRESRARIRSSELQLSHALASARSEVDRSARLVAEVSGQRAELEERNRYLSVINAVSFALSEPMSDTAAVQRALRLVARLLDLTLVQVYIAPDERHAAEEWVVTVDARHAAHPTLPLTVLREIIERGQPVFVAEREPAPMLLPDDDAYAIVPLSVHGTSVGAFALKGRRPAGWSEPDQHLVLLLGREIAGAVENARLYREALGRASREALIAGVARQLHGMPATADAWAAVLSQLQAVFGEAVLALVLTPPGSRAFQLAAVRGGLTEADTSWTMPEAWLAEVLELPGLVDQREQPLLVDGYGEAALPPALRSDGIRQLFIAPVRRARLLCGALIVASPVAAAWGQHEREVLGRLGDVIGQRVESDALTRLQSRRIDELSVLAEIAQIVQSTVDVERLISGFARAFQRLIPSSHLYIARLSDEGELEQVHAFGQGSHPEPPETITRDARHRWFTLRASMPWFRAEDSPPAFVSLAATRGIVVPLRPKGMGLGVAVVVTDEEPSEELCALAEQACGQLALALDSVALYRKATDRAARIQVLGNLARIVASAASLREAFDAFAEEVRWLIPFDRAAMLLVSPDEHEVTPYATYPEREIDDATTLRIAGSPVAAVTRAAGPVTLSRRDLRYSVLDWSVFGASAAMVAAVPVFRGEACVAVFALVRDAEGAHGERYALDDLAAMEEVARLLAVSIERADLFEQAEYSARHDMLTGLPNYRYLQERLDALRIGIDGAEGSTALLMIDMDDMKMINDSLGHALGDRTIRLVGDELRAACRDEDFVARVGGDEFMVLMEGADLAAAERVAEVAHTALSNIDLGIPGAPTRLRLSIGIAAVPADGDSTRELTEAADRAMYDAKFAGGGRTALARDRGARVSRSSRGRADRLIDTVVRSATVGSVEVEREALSLAQRYVIAAALHAGAGAVDAPALRLLVAAVAARRLRQPRDHPDRATALRLLESLEAQWRPESGGAAAAAALAPLAVELAWLQAPSPTGEALDLEAALARLKAQPDEDSGARLKLAALERAARSAAVERRRQDAA